MYKDEDDEDTGHSGTVNLAEFVALTLAIMQFADDADQHDSNTKKGWGMPADRLESLTEKISELQAAFSLYVKEQEEDEEHCLRVSDLELAEFSRYHLLYHITGPVLTRSCL